MACGCKNNGNQTPPPPPSQQVQTAQTQQTAESVKSAIKKTVEKYYTANKTNGWIKG